MAKHTEIEGYSVIVFVPVGAVGYRRTRVLSQADAKLEAEELKKAIREKLHAFAFDTIDVEEQAAHTCDSCGEAWTEKSDDYNGGCCDADEEDEEQRKRDNGQLGVGA